MPKESETPPAEWTAAMDAIIQHRKGGSEPPSADWRQAAEERGRLAFEAAVAPPAESTPEPTPVSRKSPKRKGTT